MKKQLTPDEMASRKKMNTKIFKFGCLPILIFIFLIFVLPTMCADPPPPLTASELWKDKAERFESNINEASDIDVVTANFDAIENLLNEYTPELSKDSTLTETHTRLVASIETKEITIQQKGRNIAQAKLFSAWDGSNRGLVNAVKNGMNDPDSFDHVETLVWDNKDGNSFIVKMKFRGKNAFGGTVTNTVRAIIDYNGAISNVNME